MMIYEYPLSTNLKRQTRPVRQVTENQYVLLRAVKLILGSSELTELDLHLQHATVFPFFMKSTDNLVSFFFGYWN